MSPPRAIVTGLGAVTPFGAGVAPLWDGLLGNRRALSPLTRFDSSGLRNERAGQVNEFTVDPSAYGLAQLPDLGVQFLLAAASEALADAGLTEAACAPCRVGASIATNFGGSPSWELHAADLTAGPPSYEHLLKFAFHSSLDCLREAFGAAGPMTCVSTACAAGSTAVGLGLDMIRAGRADVVICGGYDALAPTHLAGLSVLRTMTADDILPFSANRSGTLFGEGSGVLILERAEHAEARCAPGYCEVLGWAENNNAYHLTAPDPGGEGMIRVLAAAVDRAGVQPSDIDYISAHGTGTQYHDPEETHAIKAVLGDHAYRIAVSSIKGAIGHLMGAAGAVEAAVTAMAIRSGAVPPTMNDGVADPEMDLDFVVNCSRELRVDCAASISAGIGGHNSCVVFGAPGWFDGRRQA